MRYQLTSLGRQAIGAASPEDAEHEPAEVAASA
jgi:hypothetical protein